MTTENLTPERLEDIRNAVRSKYRKVAMKPEGHFPYPIGEESALKLGYDPLLLEKIPDTIVRRFVGVGNPFKIRTPRSGDYVLDAGCGCGMGYFYRCIAGRTPGASCRHRPNRGDAGFAAFAPSRLLSLEMWNSGQDRSRRCPSMMPHWIWVPPMDR